MKPVWTHSRSLRLAGAVCGTNEGPATQVTDEPCLVTCPECPDAATTETTSDDAVTGDPHLITILREAKAGHTRTTDGVIVDPSTANAILTVYDAATAKTKAKIAGLPLTLMVSLAWNVLRADAEGDPR